MNGKATTTIEDYVKSRVQAKLTWYDRRAVTRKRLHLGFQYFSAIASIVLILLLHIDTVPRLALALLAATISVAVTAERIGQFGSLWHLYRLTAESLTTEQQLYLHRAGPYATAGAASDALFVERIEHLLGSEAAGWQAAVLSGKAGAADSRLPGEHA